MSFALFEQRSSIKFNSIKSYLCSAKSQHKSPQGTLQCEV